MSAHDETAKVPSPGLPGAARIAVVIPCFRVTQHILGVLQRIGPEVERIFVIDDACPDGSGDWVAERCLDPRVTVLRHAVNQGVGGAVITGYEAAIASGADVIVKLDGDGQMDPTLLPAFTGPILDGSADYTKGNRFHHWADAQAMPLARWWGNAAVSFLSKLSSGYWDVFDPANGYTAIHARVAEHVPFSKLSRRYFFESDMLFRLGLLRSVVVDVPMEARYGDEISHLRIRAVIGEFFLAYLRNGMKRVAYQYFLRDVSVASFALVLGSGLTLFGATFGAHAWWQAAQRGEVTPAGTVMVAALPLIVGVQLLLTFLTHDIQAVPRLAIHKRLRARRGR